MESDRRDEQSESSSIGSIALALLFAATVIAIAVAFVLAGGQHAKSEELTPEREPASYARHTGPSWANRLTREAVFASPGPKPPGRWCGWKARQLVGRDPGPDYNLAAKWRDWGSPSGPVAGAIAYNGYHVCRVVSVEGNTIQCHGGNQCGKRGARTECVAPFPVGAYRYRVG